MASRVTDFATCYSTYYERLYRVAYRIAGNREDAEDALQEAYLNAFKAFDNFKGNSAFGTWIYRITVNSTLRFVRKRKEFPISEMARREGISEAQFFENLKDHESVEDEVITENIREVCLQMFLECMPKQQRIAYVLKTLMKLPGVEVAEIMGTSVGAVKTNVYRARLLMQENLEGRCSLIREGNPCKCGLWAAYCKRTGKENLYPKEQIGKNPALDYKTLFFAELSHLDKMALLYDVQPNGMKRDDFVQMMREKIREGNLLVLK